MLDIDFFKLVNDQHGHLVGDELLRAIADILRENSRRRDCIARYGGEEFCVMLAGTCENGAVSWAERIRESICNRRFPSSGQSVHVTASFGVAQQTEETTSVEHLIHRADEALLVAKQTGRNRVVSQAMLELATVEPCTSAATDPRFAGHLARHLMIPAVVCLTQDETLRSSSALLMTLRLESAPIVDNEGRMVGLVSEDAIMTQLLAGDDWDDHLHISPDSPPACFVSDTPISVVWDFLRRVPVRRVVVVEGKRPVGIISRSNLLRWLHESSAGEDVNAQEDAHAQCEASAELADVIDRLSHELRRLRRAVRSSEDAAPLTLISASRMQDLLDLLLDRSQCNYEANAHSLVEVLQ
jgi:diguanylate cyclase (GGDEF)-like protein